VGDHAIAVVAHRMRGVVVHSVHGCSFRLLAHVTGTSDVGVPPRRKKSRSQVSGGNAEPLLLSISDLPHNSPAGRLGKRPVNGHAKHLLRFPCVHNLTAGPDRDHSFARLGRAHPGSLRFATFVQPDDQRGGRRGVQLVLDGVDDESLDETGTSRVGPRRFGRLTAGL
jgi:hypothetical protein